MAGKKESGGGEVHISRHSSKSQTAAKNKTMASSRRKGGIRLLQVGSRLSAIGLASPVVAGPWSDAAAPFTPGSHDSHGSHSTHAGPRASVHPFTRSPIKPINYANLVILFLCWVPFALLGSRPISQLSAYPVGQPISRNRVCTRFEQGLNRV